MEKVIIRKLVGMFGLPDDAAGFFTSGGSLGKFDCKKLSGRQQSKHCEP
jgi:hypothetical protein